MHDQTDSAWLDGAELRDIGAAILLFRFEGLPPEKVWAWDVTLRACRMMAAGALAFKWLPYRLFSKESLQTAAISPGCGQPCVTTCVPQGCICDPINGICV
jgi:hypothetical protein